MHMSLPGLNVARSSEGRALRPYKDSTGTWTVGYGLTNFDKGLPFKVAQGLVLTPDQCEWLLVWTLATNYEPAVSRALVNPSQSEFDAGTDFHFNTGGIAKATWPKRLNAGDKAGAKASLLSWDKAGGRVLSGLTKRREREWAMIDTGDYGPEAHEGPTEILVSASGGEIDGKAKIGPLTALPTQVDMPVGPGGTLVSMTVPAAPAEHMVPGVLQMGARGADVSAAQKSLVKFGYLTAASFIDGDYDEPTATAVYNFQSHHPNLTADGKVGPATRAQFVREANLRKAVPSHVGGTVAIAAASAGVAAWGDAGPEVMALVATCAAVVGLLWLTAKYGDELSRNLNGWLGRVVP